MFFRYVNKKTFGQVCVAGAVSSSYIILHWPLVDRLKRYKLENGIFSDHSVAGMTSEKPEISPYLRNLIDETLNEMVHMDEHKKKKLEFISAPTLHGWTIGSTLLKKSIVAIPDYFNVKDAKDLRANKLNELFSREFDYKVPKELWLTPDGKMVAASFLMSDEAKKYMIARLIGNACGPEAIWNATLLFFSMYTYYLMIYLYERSEKLRLSHLPLSRQMLIIMSFMGAVAFLYYGIKVYVIENHKQQNGEAFALSLGLKQASDIIEEVDNGLPRMLDDRYYESCLEYNHKVMDRNSGLHQLVKQSTPFYSFKSAEFTRQGDQKSGLLSPELGVVLRMEIVRKWRQGKLKTRNHFAEGLGLEKPPSFEPVKIDNSIEEAVAKKLNIAAIRRKTLKRGKRDISDVQRHVYDHLEEITFRALGRDFKLILHRKRHFVSPRFKIYTVDSSGKRKPYVNLDQNEFYEGRLSGSLNSTVNAHIDSETGLITASINDLDKGELYIVEPSWRHEAKPNWIYKSSEAKAMIVYKVDKANVNLDALPRQHLVPRCGNVAGSQVPVEQFNHSSHVSNYSRKIKRSNFDVVHSGFLDYTRCSLLVVADYLFYEKMGGNNVKQTVSFLVSLIDRVNTLFLSTNWADAEDDGILNGFGFFIHEILVHDEPNDEITHYNNPERQWNVRDMLKTFSHQDHRGYCLAHLFTHRKFDNSVLGLAYVASPVAYRAGGICSKATISEGKTFYFNTGLTSTMNTFGQSLITRTADLVTAHELGHNWGAEHDPDSEECSPGSRRGGPFVMYAYSVSGYDDNNKVFSPCSKRAIRNVLLTKSASCFIEEAKAYCGNEIVEDGEECDAGHDGQRDTDPCCDTECRLRPGADCSSRNSPCCNGNCRIVPAGGVASCSRGNPLACTRDSYCDGYSASCPVPEHQANGEECLDNGKCRNGVCVPFCETQGLHSCMCDDKTNACIRCCRRFFNSTCQPFTPQERLSDGTPCVYGFCERGICKKSVQDVVQRFWDVIEEINPNSFVKFLKDNIVGVVIFSTAFLWIPICWYVTRQDKNSRVLIKEKVTQIRRSLTRPSTSSERSYGPASQQLLQPTVIKARSQFGAQRHMRNPMQLSAHIVRPTTRSRPASVTYRAHHHAENGNGNSHHLTVDEGGAIDLPSRYSRDIPALNRPGSTDVVTFSTKYGLNLQPHVNTTPTQSRRVVSSAPIARDEDELDDPVQDFERNSARSSSGNSVRI
ncbi:ADAM 17-like protease [Halotydeus destructor]|nr:ADAM 17-like protease [Halotydeus destructor]